MMFRAKVSEYEKALGKAFRMLAQRDHSELEIKNKLKLKFTAEIADQVITRLNELNYIPSAEKLSLKAYKALSLKGKSYGYITNYLRKKGLPKTNINIEEEVSKITKIIESKLKNTDLKQYDQKVKLMRSLYNRGFYMEHINIAFDEVMQDKDN